MASKPQVSTLGELKESNYKVVPVREELRNNLINKIKAEEEVFPGIIGFENTVIPQLENALLSGQDIILLGERGQAKSRLIRGLVNLLDPYIPVVMGCEINDDPYKPVCYGCREKAVELGEDLPVDWITPSDR